MTSAIQASKDDVVAASDEHKRAADAAALTDAAGPPAHSGRCRNCGAAAPDHYCPHCGQSTQLHPPSAREFVHEFLGHHVAFEGSLWRTLSALLLRPGRLTVEYFAGRRQRYIAPLRLYLTVSLILFAVSGLNGHDLKLGNERFEFRMPTASDKGQVVVIRTDPNGPPLGNGPIDRVITRVAAMTPEQRNARIDSGVRTYLPYVLIVLVPMLAVLLKGIYWKRRMLYGEHLVVAFHAQTVAFFFAIVSALPLGDTVGTLWTVLLVAHGAIALRKVYGGRWIPTLIRESLLLTIYGMVVGIALAVLVALSLAL